MKVYIILKSENDDSYKIMSKGFEDLNKAIRFVESQNDNPKRLGLLSWYYGSEFIKYRIEDVDIQAC